MFLSVERVKTQLELERTRQVQKLIKSLLKKNIAYQHHPVSPFRRGPVCRAGKRGFREAQQPESLKNW